LKSTDKSSEEKEPLAQAVLDSLSAHIAILDHNGIILKTNRAWKDFALANQIKMRPDMTGVNYLELCESVEGDSAEEARNVANGIKKVIAGEENEFVVNYACHSLSVKRWFYMRATLLSMSGPLRVVVSHENITNLKLTEESLKKREKDLEIQTNNLTEANIALKVLLKHREEDKQELEEKVLSNVKELVTPYIEKIKMTELDSRQKEYVKIIERNLNDISSSFLHHISSEYSNLTPQEIHVASLIKNGMTTKEIAVVLNVSASAVDFHRKNIRKKFGLTNQKSNLGTYLLSFSK